MYGSMTNVYTFPISPPTLGVFSVFRYYDLSRKHNCFVISRYGRFGQLRGRVVKFNFLSFKKIDKPETPPKYFS